MTAHLAGAPMEELLVPLAATGSAMILASRLVLARFRSRRHASNGSMPTHDQETRR